MMVLKPKKKVRNAAEVIQLLKEAGFDVQTKVNEPNKGFSALIGKRNLNALPFPFAGIISVIGE